MTVDFGTPITTREATMALLRMIKSPVAGNIGMDSDPSHTIRRLRKIDHMLSGGERRLLSLAEQVWRPSDDTVAALGGLDHDIRRKALVVLLYLYLGREPWPLEIEGHREFTETFR